MGSGQCILRDRAGEDDYGLGVAAFFHARRSNWELPSYLGSTSLNMSFGLGVNNGTKLNYFFGPSFGYGGAYLTVGGLAAGAIPRR